MQSSKRYTNQNVLTDQIVTVSSLPTTSKEPARHHWGFSDQLAVGVEVGLRVLKLILKIYPALSTEADNETGRLWHFRCLRYDDWFSFGLTLVLWGQNLVQKS